MQVLLTCWRPSLDVACAVDHSILGFSFFHRAKAIPRERTSVSLFSTSGGEARMSMTLLVSKLLGSPVGLVVFKLDFPPSCFPSSYMV